jgi:alpha-ketoglutarate-dependent taurine dioxygenase
MYQNFESLEALLKAVPEDEKKMISVNHPQFEKQIQDLNHSYT